ncbi:hypothetical protein ACEWY4_012917 [Coilia grayii]|uniref:G-protein coupled receptors family 1 profile domain-containing protein n=1 Tax=Coilia grayii TaxID=363190 RepID=A0ABD1JUS5_9TELE
MNLTIKDAFETALVKNLVIVAMGIVINCINGIIILTFFRNSVFHCETRYILYMNLVVNDMTMIFVSVTLHVLTHATSSVNSSVCCTLIVISSTTYMNTPIILAGMAIERYIAICKPLHHTQICTVRRTYVLIGLTWAVGFTPTIVDVFIVYAIEPTRFFSSVGLCHPLIIYISQIYAQKTQVVQGLYMSFVWLMLIYTYLRVFLTARAATCDAASAKKAQSTILLHGAQLLLCMLSYITPYIEMALVPFFPVHRSTIMFLCYLITMILPRLLSPLIYSIRDQKFAKCMSQYYSCRVNTPKEHRKRRRMSSFSKKVFTTCTLSLRNTHVKIPMNPYSRSQQ